MFLEEFQMHFLSWTSLCLLLSTILDLLMIYLTIANFVELDWLEDGVNEWVLSSANSAIVQLYNGENKLIFNETMSSTLF